MPNRSSNRGNGPKDANEIAFSVVQQATGQAPKPEKAKNPAAVTLGRLGGLKGGKARADLLTPKAQSDPGDPVSQHAERTATIMGKPPVIARRQMENSSELAEYVLAVAGPELHVNDIIEQMRTLGWQGSGDARKDYKNVHQLLVSKTDRFQKGNRRGTFRRVHEVGEAKLIVD